MEKFHLLENITQPADIKNFSDDQLNQLACEIRDALIYNISNTGGHLASNLGIVELTLAIHKVFDSPKDKIVFDVGHQCYVHKMLTGRYSGFSELRKKDGISGFPNPCESVHDVFKTGHSSTSISSALGLAYGMSLSGDNESSSVAVIGDGSMTGGLAYEGLNNAGGSKKNIIVILNDNNMSISKNVGAIAKAFTYMRNKKSYFKFKDFIGNFIVHIPLIGKPLYRRVIKFKSAVKSYFYSSNIFEGMGFKYIGPVDGHDISALTRVLTRAKSLKCPVFVHVKTKKGKGYSFAENSPREFHGVGEFDIDTGSGNKSHRITYTDFFGKALVDLATNHKEICAITAAMGPNCGLTEFMRLFPDRYFDVGIAESHAVTFASGLARMGKVPFVCIYSTFLQRAYDQIIHDISLQKLKAVFAVDRAGIVGEDGETHQGLFDVPMLMPIPDISVFSPSTADEIKLFMDRAVYDEKLSSFIRYPKGSDATKSDYPFNRDNSDWQYISCGSDVVAISYGYEIFNVLDAISGKEIDVIKLNLINRFSNELIEKIKGYSYVFFAEECYKHGGVGECLEAALRYSGFVGNYVHIGIDNNYVKHCSQSEARELCGIDSSSIRKVIERTVGDEA